MSARVKRIPKTWPVQPLKEGQAAKDKATCGGCGLSWDDGKVTGWTPAPGGRCPFEAFHIVQKEKPTTCLSLEIAGMPITLEQTGIDRFTVTYWKQIKRGLDYGRAASELGGCIMHALACDGKLDNREEGEA